MKTKIIPFDLETAKKIQAGEIKGRIRTKEGDFTTRIICFDKVKLVHFDGATQKQIVSLIYNENAHEDVMYVHNQKGEVQTLFGWEHGYDLVLEVPDNESQRESKQNFETVAESDAYAEGYENGFRAGRCIAFDDKGTALKTNEPQFKPFDKVLVRQSDKDDWRVAFYSHFNPEENLHVTAWLNWYQCIPYEGNEMLVGTTDKPKED